MQNKFRDDYYLLWHDEFDQNELDLSKWNIIHGGRVVNNELQYYTNGDNITFKDSCIYLWAKKEDFKDKKYTSARINTRQKADFTNGRIEFRAMLPKGVGTWPALWMMGSTNVYGGWPHCGEIDIMEHVGYNQNFINTYFHTGGCNHMIGNHRGNRVYVNDVSSNFNVYAIEWSKERIDVYVNDVLIYSLKKNEKDTYLEWPFDSPHHIIMNLAIGGSWGGKHGVDDSIFPCALIVDYVRVYDMTKTPNGEKREISSRVDKDVGQGGI